MPELPEVETIRCELQNLITGKKIKRVDIRLAKIIKAPATVFSQAALGATIKKISRRAKILIFELDNGVSIIFHLKLSGQLIFNGALNKHTHLIFYFTDNTHLIFNDLRKFAYVKLIKTNELPDFIKKEGLGPEPLKKEFTLRKFQALLEKKPNAKIKPWLMDQKNIAGIGNIYSAEILFAAGVHPFRKNNALKTAEIKKIFQNIKKILCQAIKYKGTSAENYLDAFGKEGSYFRRLKVYSQEGKKCLKCQGEIKRIKISGRSAYFCPRCQT